MSYLLAFITVITVFGKDVCSEEPRMCVYTSSAVDRLHVQGVTEDGEDGEYGVGKVENGTETCVRPTDHCYAFWREDPASNNTGGVIYIAQGCWESSGKQDCEANKCISKRKPPKYLNNTNYCCCTGDFCNTNASYVYTEDTENSKGDLEEPVEMVPLERMNLALVTVFVALGMLTVAFIFVVLRVYHSLRDIHGKPGHEAVHLIEHGTHLSNTFNADDLKLESLIGQGRYGSVWKASAGDMEVAVKIVPLQHRIYFYNERDIYTLPFMNHPSLLSYYGCDERSGPDGSQELMLILSLAPLGSLQCYLRENTLDWPVFCKMALAIATGLAHLHTDVKKGDKLKPCLSHRDLNSNNILVKEDLSCAICDLGFATRISGSKYYFNGEEQHAETKSITDVGTLRYMSPEVLEGAVNLRDCETSLKQIDVYALGLVLWELASRCTDFFPSGIECAPYKLPFEAEIGHPSLEQMQVLVCRHKARPLFPDLWRDTSAVRAVKETIEDCWDHDAEARLTALCAEERFHDLSGFTERQKGTVYTTGISPSGRGSCVIQREAHNVFGFEVEKEGDSCQSETTTDTILTITPTNPQINCKNSNQLFGFCPSVQPYQGRNPCLERNLMAPRDGDSNYADLIDKSHKHVPQDNAPLPSHNPGEYMNVQQQPPMAPPPRPSLPIPYLQNVSNEPTQPKVSNLMAGCPRRSTWNRLRQGFTSRRQSEELIGNESAITVTTPVEDKLHTKVALSNGKTETRLTSMPAELGTQNNHRPNTLPLSTPISRENSTGKFSRDGKALSYIEATVESDRALVIEDLDTAPLISNSGKVQLLGDAFGSNPRLKDPNTRVKTPGDVPLEVRRVRGQKNVARFSLYDDRIMSGYYDSDKLISQPKSCSEGLRSSLDDAHFSQNI